MSDKSAKEQWDEVLDEMRGEAKRLTDLVESRKISVERYKHLMWANLGISPHCLEEGVSFILKPEVQQPVI